MSKFTVISRLCMAMAALIIQTNYAAAAVVADQLNEYTNPSTVAGTALGTNSYVGQVVTVGITGKLDAIEIAVRKFDGFTFGDLTLQIRDVMSGKPGNNVLGAATFPNSSIAATPALYTKFDLSPLNLTFSAGQQFAVVLVPSNHSGSPFPLALSPGGGTYSGGDLASSGDGINWQYWTSTSGNRDTYFRTYVGEPVEIVAIDIKPGSDPNCFAIDGHGVVPVAILGSTSFNVSLVDPVTLRFGALEPRVRGNRGPMCHQEDVNGDGHADLVCQFEDDPTAWSPNENATATLTGATAGGKLFRGTDSICIK